MPQKKTPARKPAKAKPTSRSKVAPKAAKARPTPKSKAAPKAATKLAIPAKSALITTIKAASQLQFTANSKALLVARDKKKTLTLFDLDSQTETPPLPALPTFTAVALSPDSRFLAMGTSTGILAVQSTQTGKTLWKSKATGEPVGQVLFSLDGTYLFAAPPAPEGSVLGAAEEGTRESHWIRVHKAATGDVEQAFTAIPGAICCHMALSPEGLFLAHAELQSNSVLIWHLPTRQMSVAIHLQRNRGQIRGLSFGITLRHLTIAQQTQTTHWNAGNGTQLGAIETPGMRSVAVVDHGDTIAAIRTVDEVSHLELLKADTGFLRKSIRLHIKPPSHLIASPDGALLAMTTGGDACVWRIDKLLG